MLRNKKNYLWIILNTPSYLELWVCGQTRYQTQYLWLMSQVPYVQDADELANSVDPDRSNLIWVGRAA